MDSYKVGNYISKLRKERRLTQEQLAEKIGVSNKTISKWENGINIPDTAKLFELSKMFNVDIHDILNGEKINNSIENNNAVIKTILFYNNIFRKKITRFFVTALIIILLLFSVFYTITNFNRYHIYEINGDSSILNIKGYVVRNPKETLFFINNFNFQNESNGTSDEKVITKYEVFVKSTDQKIVFYSESEELLENNRISNVLNRLNISFVIDNNELNDIKSKFNDNYIIEIITLDNTNVENKMLINMTLKHHFNSSKIVY